MRFKRNIKPEQGLGNITTAPLINVIFLLLMFILLSSAFTVPAGIDIKLPKTVTSDTIQEKNIVITITSEDVIYLGGHVVTTAELGRDLMRLQSQDLPVLIMADRRSSMGRIVDVWDVCRKFKIKRINVATTKEGL